MLTLFRAAEAAVRILSPDVQQSLTDAERKGWQWMAMRGRAKSSQYAAAMKVEDRTARRHLNRFVELGLASKRGSGPSTEYEVSEALPHANPDIKPDSVSG